MSTKQLLFFGVIIPVVFWASTVIAGYVHGNYNHLTGTISELGAMGRRSETFMNFCTWLNVVFSLFFIAGLFKACDSLQLNFLPIFFVPFFTVMFGWAALFHSGHRLHTAAGPVFLLLYAAPLLSTVLWRGRKFKQLQILSAGSLLIMLLIFLRFIPAVNNHCPGLIQRFAHMGWSAWFISLSICLTRLLTKQQSSNTNI